MKGDVSRLVCEKKEDFPLVGAGGGNVRGTLYLGTAQYDFADKVVKLGCDMGMGGIVGRVGEIATGVRVENCANYAEILATDSKGMGGIVGAGWGTGYIVNCYNTGKVVNEKYPCPAGGICGSNDGMDIYACYNVGTIQSQDGRGRGIGGHDSGT